MKNYLLCAALLPILNFAQMVSPSKEIDPRLVGTWTGSEKNQQIKGLKKSWVTERKADGTYTIQFRFMQNGIEQTTDETGKWATHGNIYSEYHDYDGKTDEYTYQVTDAKHVKFFEKSITVNMSKENYSFIDTRKENEQKSSKKDGSSAENAIEVKSVEEEYKYIMKNCPGCKIEGQALSESKGKFMDIIHVTDENGVSRSYYFDIKSFFGKGF